MIAKNDLLVDITDKLALAEPDWEKVVARFKDGLFFQFGHFNFDNLVSVLAEVHVKIALEEICKSYDSETREKIVFDPVEAGIRAGQYIFGCNSADQLTVAKDENLRFGRERQTYSEIDLLMLIDKLPVLFEVKLHVKRRRSRNIKPAPGMKGIYHQMENERIRHVLQPIFKYFGCSESGYVIVVPKDIANNNSPIQEDFRKRNGIIVAFYKDRKNFREEVGEINKKYGLFPGKNKDGRPHVENSEFGIDEILNSKY